MNVQSEALEQSHHSEQNIRHFIDKLVNQYSREKKMDRVKLTDSFYVHSIYKQTYDIRHSSLLNLCFEVLRSLYLCSLLKLLMYSSNADSIDSNDSMTLLILMFLITNDSKILMSLNLMI